MPPAPAAYYLPPEKKDTLDQARGALKSLQQNLKLALDAAGPGEGPVTGAKARLAQSRLNQAIASIEPLSGLFAGLPADDAEVAPLRAEFDSAQVAIKALQNRLAAPPAPGTPSGQPGTTGAPASPTPALKLDYRQAEQLKNAGFHLAEVEGNLAALDGLITRFATMPDKDRIDHRLLADAVATLENAKRKNGFAKAALDPLPPAGAGVADAHARVQAAGVKLAEAERSLLPLHERVQRVIDPATYPGLEADLARLAGLAGMYADPSILQSRRPVAVIAVRELPGAKAEAERIAQAYAVLVAQQTEQGRRVEGVGKHFAQKVGEFETQLAGAKSGLSAEVDTELKAISAMGDEAVSTKQPAWFAGGIPDRLDRLAEVVALHEAVDEPAGAASRQKLAALRADLAARAKQLEQAIIDANTIPPDRYTRDDRARLIEQAVAAWKQVEPNAEILKSCIPGDAWSRDTYWRWEHKAWRLIDHSKLQVQLLVRRDDRLVVIRPIDLWIDHTAGDTKTAVPMDAPSDALPPHRFLLASKIK